MSALERLLEGDALDWPEMFPERLSPSSVAKAASCPEAWRQRYVLGRRDTWGGAAITGLAVHRAVELNMGQKIETGVDLERETMREMAAVAFEDKIIEAEKDGIEWGDTSRGDAKDEAVSLTDAYHTQIAPTVTPIAVEQWVGGTIPGAPELTGRVDIVARDHGIIDVKTTGRKPSNGRPRGDWGLKASMYVLMTGQPFTWHVLTKTRVPAIYTPETDPGLFLPASDAVKRLATRRVQTVAAGLVDLLDRYGPEDPWPTNATEHDWSCNYCEFRSDCAWWAS